MRKNLLSSYQQLHTILECVFVSDAENSCNTTNT